jgi:hypothetical protein
LRSEFVAARLAMSKRQRVEWMIGRRFAIVSYARLFIPRHIQGSVGMLRTVD